MPLFAVIGFDQATGSAQLREQGRPAHRAYVQANDAGIRFAGAMYGSSGDQCGSLLIIEAEDIEAVWSWCRAEPFYQSGVYGDFHVVPWRCARNDLPQTGGWVTDFPARANPESLPEA